jgi:DNA mismatch repair protein MutL
MSKIRILPDRVANQIAAGEVIERPAAVVKELVENALDAGASRVEVEFRDGGRTLIRVEDDGSGMGRDDALLSLERHATSKIADAADLDRLETFGFRGEALPSIASVSRFTLRTRTAESDVGTEVVMNGGRMVSVRECGRAVGTRIEVEGLFNPVPARRKFLKSDRTEAAHIVNCVRLYALASPRVAFALTEDGRTLFRSPQCPGLADRVAEIFGRRGAAGLLALDSDEPGLRLRGLVCGPGGGSSTRHDMLTFVNSRPVDSRALNFALIEACQDSLPLGRHPQAYLFLDCDPATVDVNVHPAKREVRFRNEPAVRAFVINAVRRVLRNAGEDAVPGGHPEAGMLHEPLPPAAPLSTAFAGHSGAIGRPPVAPREAEAGADPLPAWRHLGLLRGGLALFETAAGLVILDRRAAQERIWFERLEAQYLEGGVPSQRLLLPSPLELDPIDAAMLAERHDFLLGHGFEIAEFGRNFSRIESVPTWMEPGDAETFLREVLGAMREGSFPAKDPVLARANLVKMAAARAVRLPPAPGELEMLALAAALFKTRSPLVSPGGRPTFLEIGDAELARRFQK